LQGIIQLKGTMRNNNTTYGKIKIDDANLVTIDYLDILSGGGGVNDIIEIDTSSSVIIKELYSGRHENVWDLESIRNIQVVRSYSYNIAVGQAGSYPGFNSVANLRNMSGQNLFLNPSFEAGRYGWEFSSGVPGDTEEYVTSEVGNGLMGHFVWNVAGDYVLRQSITVPAGWVGQSLTITAKVKSTDGAAGNAFITFLIQDCGLTPSTGWPRHYAEEGWGLITQTFDIQSSGTLLIGLYFVGVVDTTQEYWVDDVSLSFGTEGMFNSGKYASVELGFGAGNTITYSAAAPTGGTWKKGDIVYSTVVTAGGTVGWVCTVAGSPGTWKTFGTVTP